MRVDALISELLLVEKLAHTWFTLPEVDESSYISRRRLIDELMTAELQLNRASWQYAIIANCLKGGDKS